MTRSVHTPSLRATVGLAGVFFSHLTAEGTSRSRDTQLDALVAKTGAPYAGAQNPRSAAAPIGRIILFKSLKLASLDYRTRHHDRIIAMKAQLRKQPKVDSILKLGGARIRRHNKIQKIAVKP